MSLLVEVIPSFEGGPESPCNVIKAIDFICLYLIIHFSNTEFRP